VGTSSSPILTIRPKGRARHGDLPSPPPARAFVPCPKAAREPGQARGNLVRGIGLWLATRGGLIVDKVGVRRGCQVLRRVKEGLHGLISES